MEAILKLAWRFAADGAGFRCEAPNGLGFTIRPLARNRYLEWGWIAYYDEVLFDADDGTCSNRSMAVKEALEALKKRGVDVSKLPCEGCGIPA